MTKNSLKLRDPEEIPEELVTDDVAIRFEYHGGDDELRNQLWDLGRYYLINTKIWTDSAESDSLHIIYGWQSRHFEGIVGQDHIGIPDRHRISDFVEKIRYPTIKEITNIRILEIACEYRQEFEQEIYEK